jgi:hypothetical protein
MLNRANQEWPEGTAHTVTCPSCCRAAGDPFREYDVHGRVRLGCVDAFHTGYLVTPSESSFWHARPEAKKIRRRLELMRLGKLDWQRD